MEEPLRAPANTEYVCPMHPEIVRDEPGACPICGMALEPKTVTLEEAENEELVDMRRRFAVSVVLTIPLVAVAMREMIPGRPLDALALPSTFHWLELLLASPVVLWGGWPFFVRAWQSVVNRRPNMFTLIGLGVAAAWTYSMMVSVAVPQPRSRTRAARWPVIARSRMAGGHRGSTRRRGAAKPSGGCTQELFALRETVVLSAARC